MKKICLILAVVLLSIAQGWPADPPPPAWGLVLRGSGGTAVRTYLLNLDFETSPNWDSYGGVKDCNLDDNGDICDQYSGEKYAGSYSFAIVGGSADSHGAKAFTAVGELYLDFWVYVTPGLGSYRVALYDSTNTDYCISFYYNSGLRIYLNTGTYYDTGWTPTANQWEHYRLYVKRDTDDTDGIIKFWASATDTDFDGDTPYYSYSSADTYDGDMGYMRARGISGLDGYTVYYDNIKIWEPDGNE